MSTPGGRPPGRRALVVCARPHDVTLWFSSVLARYRTDVVCATCGWDEPTRAERLAELERAAARHGAGALHVLTHRDDPDPTSRTRLDVATLAADLAPFAGVGYDAVFTHSPAGEVHHHPHRQDVSYAAHQVFDGVFSVAWNQYPTLTHDLTPAEYELKQEVLGSVFWRRYGWLAFTHEIAAQERFTAVGRAASEIYYWSSANFGDHHEYLGSRYPDVWGFATSPYETERHETIAALVAATRPGRILDVGAAEGHLTRRLGGLATVDCVEPAATYAARLRRRGFRVVVEPRTADYDVVVLAAVLEYLPDPDAYLAGLAAPYVLTDTHPFLMPVSRVAAALGRRYRLCDRAFVAPRWEQLRHGDRVEPMRVYKIGAEIALWHRDQC